MKRFAKKTLALLLTLTLCLGLLPAAALAAEGAATVGSGAAPVFVSEDGISQPSAAYDPETKTATARFTTEDTQTRYYVLGLFTKTASDELTTSFVWDDVTYYELATMAVMTDDTANVSVSDGVVTLTADLSPDFENKSHTPPTSGSVYVAVHTEGERPLDDSCPGEYAWSSAYKIDLDSGSGSLTPPVITTEFDAQYTAYLDRSFDLYISGTASRGGTLTWSTYSTDAYNTSGEDMGMPSGLSFSPNPYNPAYSYITGTPTLNTRSPMTVSVTLTEEADGVALSTTKEFVLVVEIMKPEIRTTTYRAGVGVPFELELQASPAYDGDTLSWRVGSGGSLPSGVTLDQENGILSGTIAAEGMYSFALAVLETTPAGVTRSSREERFALSVVTESTEAPTIKEVVYYDRNPDPNAHSDLAEYPAAWYHFQQGSYNLEAFALQAAASEAEAANTELGMSGFEVGGQWYRPVALWTVADSEIMDKGSGEKALSTPLYFTGNKPQQGTTLYLALWDYEFDALSNLVEVTVPAEGETAEGIGDGIPAPTITTASLPQASTTSAYTAALAGETASDGVLSWSVTGLPGGLSFNAAYATISGTPTAAGHFTVVATLTETVGEKTATAHREFDLTVKGTAPVVTASALPEALWGKPYEAALSGEAASGGALSWSIGSGALPAGLTLNASTGAISGTPAKDSEGDYPFTVVLTEAGNEETASAALTLRVKGPTGPNVTVRSLSPAKANLPYSIQLTGTASELGGSLSWSLAEGSAALPAGLSLAADGTISGTTALDAAREEAYAFTVLLTETKGEFVLTNTAALSLTVTEPSKYKVTYDLNGGTAAGEFAAELTVVESAEENWNQITLPAAPARTGYAFAGWRSSGTTYEPGATVTVTSDRSFLAQWTDPAPVTVTYTGQIVGSYDLRGQLTDGRFVYLNWGYLNTPAVPAGMTVSWSDLRYYDIVSIGLWTYVDGDYQEIAAYAGEPTGNVTLTPKDGMENLTVVTDAIAVGTCDGQAVTLTRNTDFQVSWFYRGGRYNYLPFMTTHTDGFSAGVSGVSSSENYSRFKWKSSDGVSIADGVAVVPLETMPAGVTVSGAVTFFDRPLPGVQVQFSQYAEGVNLNFTAATDAEGSYAATGLLPGYEASWSVLSGGRRMKQGWIMVEAGGMTHDVGIDTALAALNASLDLSDSDLDYSQRSAAEDYYSYYNRPTIHFRKGGGDGTVLGSFSLPLNYSETYYISGAEANETIYYEITGRGLVAATGSFALEGGVYSGAAPILVKPAPGVVVSLSSPTYFSGVLAWFRDGGFAGVSNDFSLGSTPQSVFAPAPMGSGTYTVALVPSATARALNAETTLSSLGADTALHTWSVTLGENRIAGLSDFTLSRAASENAAYVTKPGSTLTADREAFASTGDLLRFTGSIGLDSGLTEGRLNELQINVRNDIDGVSYSNTAPLQYLVIGGKLYDAGAFNMASVGYYYRSFSSDEITLPCEYTIYCRPGDTDWDMQLSVYADVSYNGGSQSDQLIGSALVKKPGASITTLSSYVCSEEIAVKGTTTPYGTVDIYDGETLVGVASASAKGLWEARVRLAGTDSEYSTVHVLTSRTDTARSEDLYVFHDPSGPELTGFRMSWGSNPYGINVGEGYTYAGGMSDLTFTATFKNPDKLRATVYGDPGESSQVAFQYYLTNGTVGFIQATESKVNGDGTATFSGKLPKTIYSSVTAADVLYDPILNSRPARDGIYALTDTDLAEYADSLDAAKDAMLTSNDVNLERTADADNLATINQGYAGTGMEVQALAVEYDDDTGFLQWMNKSAADWISPAPEANTVGIYNKSVVYARKADYDAQLAQLKAYATWQSALENKDSSVTASQLFFTDMKYDADLNRTDEGTYMAEFDAFSDTGRGLYAIVGTLTLDSSFRAYTAPLPDNVAALTGWSGSGAGNATLMRFWGNESSNENVSTTEKALMKYVDGGGLQNLFNFGPPNPVDIYNNTYNAGKEYIETTSESEKMALGARVDAHNIENSKEWQELKNAKAYYDGFNPYSSFRSTPYDDDLNPPTIGDRMDQIEKDIEALKSFDGSLPSMDAKLVIEMMKSLNDVADLADFLTGGGSMDPMSPLFKFLQDVPGLVCDKMTMDQIQERMDIYARLMYNWNYIQNWYNSQIGFGDERFAPKDPNSESGGGSGGGTGSSGGSGSGQQDDTGTSSAKRARDIADQSKIRKPPITNKVSNDPAGIVFEGVIENPVAGATVTLYYAATGSGDVVLKEDAATATRLLRADGVDDLIPANPVQVTGADGKYSWGVPEGLWYVTAQRGGLSGDSNADGAATVDLTLGDAARFLPVLPVQLDVNIPLVDPAAPVVADVLNTTDGIYVSFSKYMDEADVLDPGNYVVSVTGDDAPLALTASSAEQGGTPANLGSGKTYTRTVLLTPESSLEAGTALSLTVKSGVKSYAGTPMEADFILAGEVEETVRLGTPVVTVSSTNAAVTGDTVTVDRGDALVLALPDGAPDSGKIFFQIDGGAKQTYASPVAVNGDFALKAWCEAPGYQNSGEVTVTVKTNAPDNSGGSGSNGSGDNGGGDDNDDDIDDDEDFSGSASSAAETVRVTGDGEITVTPEVKDGKAEAELSAEDVADALRNAGKGDTLTVKANTRNADSVTVKLPAQAVRTVADADVDLRVETENGAVKLDADTLDQLAAGGREAAVTVKENKDGSTTVDVSSGGKTVDGTVRAALPAAGSGQTLVIVNADGSETPVKKSVVENGVVYALIPAGAAVRVADAARTFPDVPADAWYAGAVAFVSSHGLFEGTDKGFEPGLTMTRAMLATVLYRLEDAAATGANPFADVAEGKWYTDAVTWASSAGIVLGTGSGFEPNAPVTREQIATMLYRYAKLLGLDTKGRASLDGFTDGGKTASWASEAMQWAVSAGLFQGDDTGALNPNGDATRAQVAALLERMIKLIVK